MKLLVFSDSHGEAGRLSAALDAHPDAKDVVFLGDGARDVEMIEGAYPDRRFYCVRGNCDFATFLPTEGLAPFGGLNVYYTHGHLHGVKTGLELLAEQAQSKGAQVALYGHTHRAKLERWGALTLFNPGSISRQCGTGSYGVLKIENGCMEAFFNSVD
ncbi:metallophosphoesterase [uncultured Ruthenibacterium sp.]|uniref:metallophosphoesterase family protein n=1 Tax=uncultured Ruthenibacterium sp. TaxID=1905347 RepID=UPI00349E9759